MDEKILYYLRDFEPFETTPSNDFIQSVQNQLDFLLPKDYIHIIKVLNGGEGGIGPNGWLRLFPIEHLIETNSNYIFLMAEIPNYYLFGKDAADTGYAFHKQRGSIHSFGLMSDFKTDSIEFCGNNFLEFIEYLYKQ